ncbi:hypothetical protein JW992_12140, partial [candidate division KSB1 bacterium]|nr:hypothetical protein [candidate division KSB1 bacterium]
EEFNRARVEMQNAIEKKETQSRIGSLRKTLDQKKERIVEVSRSFARLQPAWADLVSSEPVDLHALQGSLPEDVLLLQLDPLGADLFVWMVSGKQVQGVRHRFVAGERDSLFQVLDQRMAQKQEVEELLTAWSARILVSLSSFENTYRKLCVVLHAPLSSPPLAAMPLPSGKRVADRFVVRNYVSLSVLNDRIAQAPDRADDSIGLPKKLCLGMRKSEEMDGLTTACRHLAVSSIENYFPVVEIPASGSSRLYDCPFAFYLTWHALSPNEENPFLSSTPVPDSTGQVGIPLYRIARHSFAPTLAVFPVANLEQQGWQRSIFLRVLDSAGTASVILGQSADDPFAGSLFVKRLFEFMGRDDSIEQAFSRAQGAIRLDLDSHPGSWARFTLWNAGF